MIMCNDTITLFYAEVVNEKATYRKQIISGVFCNNDIAYIRDKTGVTADHKAKLTIPISVGFLSANNYKNETYKNQYWTVGLSSKDFWCMGEVQEECTQATEKAIKAKYESYIVKSVEIKKDFDGNINRITVLGV